MKKRKLDFSFNVGYKEELIQLAQKEVVFIHPLGSKLYRVFYAPTYRVDLFGNVEMIDNTELVQVLNTICTRFHKGVWYFRIPDEDTRRDIGGILLEMDYENRFIEPDEVILN